MQTISIEDAQTKLKELVGKLSAGNELIITQDQKPVARLSAVVEAEKPRPRLGTLKGSVLYMAPDFDAPLDDFKEYME